MSMEPEATKRNELPWQEQEAAELRAELDLMKTAGIIEVSVRNPSVAEYMAHWEGRLSDAEKMIAELEAALDEKEVASGLTSNGNLWRFWSTMASTLAVRNAELEKRLADAERVIEPFARARYMGNNAFNRADLSDNDFRAARAYMEGK